MDDKARAVLEERRQAVEAALGRSLEMPGAGGTDGLSPERTEYLLGEARDLYFNELEWEHLTEEEQIEEGSLTELAFPGFLAFVRGLLLDEVMPDSLAEADPRPEVVHLILHFLAAQTVELAESLEDGTDDDETAAQALEMTRRLIDLVLIRLNGLTDSEKERVESRLIEG